MLKYGIWDLPGLDFFQYKNVFKGSKGSFRFAAFGGEDIKVLYWYKDVCLECAEDIKEEHFELTEDSLYKINEFLSEKSKAE